MSDATPPPVGGSGPARGPLAGRAHAEQTTASPVPSSGAVRLPFSAVVGQDEVKLALLLAAAQPRLAGVLLRGEKGSAKTTLARGLAALLPGDGPFVELPLGATEDRLLGSVDVAELLTTGSPRVRTGLLAAADGGVLYVDEINLLADHLVDALLDVAVSGVNRIERDGVSHSHPARFVLVGSMNPEEGELRPQLLDRFGLAVDVVSSDDPAVRAEVVRRQLAAERGLEPVADVADQDADLRRRLAELVPAEVPDELIALASAVAVAVGAEGLRADLMLCRAAAAHAGWEGRSVATEDDLRVVAPLVLGHRRRRSPFDDPGLPPEVLDDAFDQAAASRPDRDVPPPPADGADERAEVDRSEAPGSDGSSPQAPPDGESTSNRRDDGQPADGQPADQPPESSPGDPGRIVAPVAEVRAPALGGQRLRTTTAPAGRRSVAQGDAGRFVRDKPFTDGAPVAALPTALAAAGRRAADPTAAAVDRADLRSAVRERKVGNLVILAVDTSGSMGAERRIALAKGAVLALLTDAYQRRDRVALVAFRGENAEVVLRPTASVEIARSRLADLPVGGPTPLAAGLDAALKLAQGGSGDQGLEPLIVLITDGRATSGGVDPLAQSQASAERVAQAGIPCVVVDAERSPRLGLAVELATILGADLVDLDHLTDGHLERTIRTRLTTPR